MDKPIDEPEGTSPYPYIGKVDQGRGVVTDWAEKYRVSHKIRIYRRTVRAGGTFVMVYVAVVVGKKEGR